MSVISFMGDALVRTANHLIVGCRLIFAGDYWKSKQGAFALEGQAVAICDTQAPKFSGRGGLSCQYPETHFAIRAVACAQSGLVFT